MHTPPARTLLNSMHQPLEVIPTNMETFGVNRIIIVTNNIIVPGSRGTTNLNLKLSSREPQMSRV